jgi:hypothetical protein
MEKTSVDWLVNELQKANYIPKDSINIPAPTFNGLKYVIIRTYSAGVFAGYLESRNGKEVILRQARRLWAWYGAASLSELAVHGINEPDKCKFPVCVDKIICPCIAPPVAYSAHHLFML